MTPLQRCHVCERPCVRVVEPAFEYLPAVLEPDVWTVAMRNSLYVDACQSCWAKWPDAHKLFPEVGFGRVPRPRSTIGIDELVELLGGAS